MPLSRYIVSGRHYMARHYERRGDRLRILFPYFLLFANSCRTLVVVKGLCITLAVSPRYVVDTPLKGGHRFNSAGRRRVSTALCMGHGWSGERKTLVVIGGGAAGYFGAIQAASSSRGAGQDISTTPMQVVVLEAGKLPLQKVKISGGGRCNVMHDSTKAVSLIAQGYPRGSKQLVGPFKSLFGPADAATWFRSRGVELKTEGDGRMFPQSDNSQTIIDCLQDAASKAGVFVVTSAKVTSMSHLGNPQKANEASFRGTASHVLGTEPQPRFDLIVSTATPLSGAIHGVLGATTAMHSALMTAAAGSVEVRGKYIYRISCDYVLQATGAAREGHQWAKGLGHAVSPPVPSLFTLTVRDPRLEGLAGLSVQDAELKLFANGNGAKISGQEESIPATSDLAKCSDNSSENPKKKRKSKKSKGVSQRGPLLVTHSGLSGPAALKLSAFGARELSEGGYKGKLVVNWLAGSNANKAMDALFAFKTRNPKKTVHAFCPLAGGGGEADSSGVPRRLWQKLALASGVSTRETWAEVAKAKLMRLALQLTACEFEVVGKGSFKDEFVTCGGVSLSSLDMNTMESRTIPGLFFAGEVVDIDGVTGGYNFQSAWTTGWVAGNAIGARAAQEAASSRETNKEDCTTVMKIG